MSGFIGDWHVLLILLLAGILPNEIWRVFGLLFGRGIDEGSELLVWVRASATAILAGVIRACWPVFPTPCVTARRQRDSGLFWPRDSRFWPGLCAAKRS